MERVIRSDFTKFLSWKKKILDRHELRQPDGRALYLYRLSEDDFNELEQLLCRLIPGYGLTHISGLAGFAELFVLYAAEWWRRRYDGSGFSWEPILRDLLANPEDWDPNQRSKYVEHGFSGWRIRLHDSGGLRFIGTVAVQGGLPLKLLASSRGSIGQLLGRVLYLASGTQVSQSALQNWVESLANTLPRSYRQGTIYTLLADVAWTIVKLKDEANLDSSADAVGILDRKIPHWRDRFPLPVEDIHAQGMIEQLVRDSVSVRIEKKTAVLPVERLLENPSGDDWVLRSNLILPDVISFEKVATLFSVDVEELPRRAELTLQVGPAQLAIGMRSLAGQRKFRLERKPLGFSGESAKREHLLHMASPDGRVWTVTASRGDELDSSLPWVFTEQDSSVYLVRQGSGSVTTPKALVAMPEGWELGQDGEPEIYEKGLMHDTKRRIVAVRGVLRAHSRGGLSFRLRTGRAEAGEETYAWGGDRYWLDFLSPSLAFRGHPILYCIDKDDNRRKLEVKLAGSNSVSGPLHLRYPAHGDIQYRSKVLVLPRSANVELFPTDAVSGGILFSNWGFARVCVTTENIEHSAEVTDNDALLEVSVREHVHAPELIELEAYWLHSTVPVRFRLPFPARGVRVLDGEGRLVADRSVLAVQQLQGVRILVSGGQSISRAELKIMGLAGRHTLKYPLSSVPGALSMGIRLQDYLPEIKKLFSVSDLPDARITIQCSIQGELMFTLFLARYSAILECDGDMIRLTAEGLRSQELRDLEQISVLAMRLESPGDEALLLEPHASEGVATGSWLFSPQLRSPGSWLIFPDADSILPFRPTLWFVNGELDEDGGLSDAFSVVDQQTREQRIDDVIDMLASNFQEKDWGKIEQLVSQIGHLPLPTLDIWRRFANSSRGMGALALRFSSLKPEFIIRFSEELPFAWEAIAIEDWRVAMSHLDAQCTDLFGKQAAQAVLVPHLTDRLQFLTSQNGSLAYSLGIAASNWLPDTRKDLEPLRFVGKEANNILFEGENSKKMKLRRIHADDEWPTDLRSTWSSIELDPKVELYQNLNIGAESYRTGVIKIPIILATQVVNGQTIEWFHNAERIHALRNYQAFDQDWFEEAYNQTIAHCFADGLLDEIISP